MANGGDDVYESVVGFFSWFSDDPFRMGACQACFQRRNVRFRECNPSDSHHLDLFEVLFTFYHGKSPLNSLNHLLGEYFRTFSVRIVHGRKSINMVIVLS